MRSRVYIGELKDFENLINIYETITTLSDAVALDLNLSQFGTVMALRGSGENKNITGSISPDEHKSDKSEQLFYEYRQAIKKLPCPSAEQTANFAAYVADAHSWYKHLPVYPKTPVYFYLDPSAGMRLVRKEDGTFHCIEQTASNGIHYNHLPTAEYLEQFGHWNYHVDMEGKLLDPIKLLQAEFSGVVPPSLGTSLYTKSGRQLSVPPRLLYTGCAMISAFVHEETPFDFWADGMTYTIVKDNGVLETLLPQAPEELCDELQFIWAVLESHQTILSSSIAQSAVKYAHSDVMPEDTRPLRFWKNQNYLVEQVENSDRYGNYTCAFLTAEAIRTLKSRKYAVLWRQKLNLRLRLTNQLLTQKDKECLLEIWQRNLSGLDVAEAIEILLQEWDKFSTPKAFIANEYKELDQNGIDSIRNLVKERLALIIHNISNDEKTRNAAYEINRSMSDDEWFTDFARRYYPESPVVKKLIDDLSLERITQMEGMMSAMNRFAKAVFQLQ